MNTKDNLMAGLKRHYLNHSHRYHLLLLILIIVVLYWPVYHFKFLIGWDDQWFVTNRFTESGLTWQNVYAILTSFYHGQYAPLNQLYYTLLYSLFGYDTACFHLGSLLLHAVNVVLVYFLTNSVVVHLVDKSRNMLRTISFMTALLFAILPFNVEPVAWVSASKVLLYALFYLLALLCYCKYLSVSRPVYFYLTLLFFIFSFGAKEQAVLLPVCLLLLDYMYKCDLKNKKIWFEKLPFFLLALLFGLITIQSQVYYGEGRTFYPIYQRIPLALFTLMEYFTKSLIPVNLSYLYPYPFQSGEAAPAWMWLYVMAVPGAIYCLFHKIKTRWVLFGLLFFGIHIAPVCNIFSLARYSFLANRYAYMSDVGLCFILGCSFVLTFAKMKYRRSLRILMALYGIGLFSYARTYQWNWEDAYHLKERIKTTIEARADFEQLKNEIDQ